MTVYVPDSTALTTTDDQGRFLLTDVPPGLIHLVADGSTTTRPGSYPKLSFEVHTVSGVDHPMDTVYLVALNEGGIFVSQPKAERSRLMKSRALRWKWRPTQ